MCYHEILNRNSSSSVIIIIPYQPASGSNVSTITVCQELHEMGFHDWAAAHKPKIIGLWSRGNAFSRVMNHPPPSGSPTDKSWFGGCQENATCRMHSTNCKVWWRSNGLGLFFMVQPRPLTCCPDRTCVWHYLAHVDFVHPHQTQSRHTGWNIKMNSEPNTLIRVQVETSMDI
jgi:hypothetical protein